MCCTRLLRPMIVVSSILGSARSARMRKRVSQYGSFSRRRIFIFSLLISMNAWRELLVLFCSPGKGVIWTW